MSTAMQVGQSNARSTSARIGRGVALALALLLPFAATVLPTAANAAVGTARIDLKVLVLTIDNNDSVNAITTALAREGVPYSTINITGTPGSRTAITLTGGANALSTTTPAPRAYYQAIVAPTHLADLVTLGRITIAERTAIETYEKAFGVRQIDAYVYPSTAVGLNAPTYPGKLDGSTATLTPTATTGAFSYLDGSFPLDDVAPTVDEVYGYLATASTPALGSTATYTPYVTVPVPSAPATVGNLVGVYASGGREELVITAAANGNQSWAQYLAQGLISWATRGVFVGYDRHYYAVNVDDVFLPDSRWSAAGKCTPGDDCLDPLLTTERIRMVPSDVSRLTAWQTANDFTFDMVFNGGGNELEIAEHGTDALTPALLAAKDQFRWISHTYTHAFLGCVQDLTVRPYQCRNAAGTGNVTPGDTNANNYGWRALSYDNPADPENIDKLGILQEIQKNQAWATTNALPNYNSTELVTGEHSGLLSLPQQPMDNPNLDNALAARGILHTGSDASREPEPRAVVGSSAKTLPRYPSNIYYNAGTYLDEVSEYNWIYTSAADGGSDVCATNSASTCITPLAMGNAAQAEASFKNYIVPLETRIAMAKVLTNDPRPHYAHQSNVAEDAILLTATEALLDGYRGVFADSAPIVSPTMTESAAILARASTWNTTGKAGTTAYLDATGVHFTGSAAAVPLTVPNGSTGSAVADLAAYAGSLSGWTTPAKAAVVADVGYGNGTVPTAPAAPAAPTGIPGDTNVALTWVAPASNNSAITSYTITPYLGAVAQTPVVTPTNAVTYTVPGLTNGTAYTFTVAATNAIGTGPASPASLAISPRALPSAPTALAGTPGTGSAALTWTAPVSDGGSPITSYTVTPYLGAVAQTPVVTPTTATAFTVTGLTGGAAYTFTVAATTLAGTGAASEASSEITPWTVPGSPTIVVGTHGDASVALTWTAPVAVGGTPVTSYTVIPYVGAVAQTPVVTPTTATAFTVTGLTNGTAYTFTVAATSLAGTGTASTASAAVTPSRVPDAPASNPVAAASPGQVALTWAAPLVDGGAPITAYVVTPYVGASAQPDIVTPTTAAGYTVTGLTNGTTYSFTVKARNLNGDGAASGASNTQTPITVPAAPAAPTGVPGDGKVTVSWVAPANGGSSITSSTVTPYLAGVAQTPVEVVGSATSKEVSGLTNGTAYTFTVIARNAAGPSTESAASLAVTPRTVAGTPGKPTGTPADQSVELTWTAPATDGGAAITSYTVTPYVGGTPQTPIVTPSGATTFTVIGLTNGTAYRFRVAATNAAGTGTASVVSDQPGITPRTVPGAPTAVTAEPGDTSVEVSWTAPASNGGSAVTGYTVTSAPGGQTCATSGALTCTVSGLTNGTAYTFTVVATNVAGNSADSTALSSVTPRALPGAPTSLTVVPGNAQVALTWVAPASDGGLPITSYRITPYVGAVAQTPVDTGDLDLAATVTGLTNGTVYTFKVAATSAAGHGTKATSAAVTPRTTPATPAAPKAKRADKSVVVSWVAPANGGAAITGYVLRPHKAGVAQPAINLAGGTTSRTVTGLTNGTAYTFTVTAANVAGSSLTSAASASVAPSGAPVVVLKKLPATAAPISLLPKVTHSWSGFGNGSAVDRYEVFVKRAKYGKPLPAAWTKVATVKSTSTVTALKAGEVVHVAVRAVDKAGTVSGLSVASSTVSLPLGAAKATKVGTWKKLTGSSHYGGRAFTSKTKGDKLTFAAVTGAKRIAVIGSRGAGYGKVAVYVGGKKVGTVNFKASKADADGVVLSKAFTARSGKVQLVVASGKKVRIQGIAVVR